MSIIIAEFCQNHLGKREILKEMILRAKEAGADYAKIQTIHSKDLTKRERFEEGLVEDGIVRVIKRPYDQEYQRLKKMDLSEEDFYWFDKECKAAGIKPMTTVFTRGSISFIKNLEWDSVKVASYDCASIPLLEDLKESFSNIFVSTGATTDQEISQAATVLTDKNFYFLHCVTIYPTPFYELNLRRMFFLKRFTNKIGFSDHTLVNQDQINASKVALWLGADVIERHVRLLDESECKDGPVSIDMHQLKELCDFAKKDIELQKREIVNEIPEWPLALGNETRNMSNTEILNRDYYRGRFADIVNGHYRYNWEE